MDIIIDKTFWKRLVLFVQNVQVNDPMSEEEKEYILETSWNNIKIENEISTKEHESNKPIINGSLLLLELFQVAAIENEDGMPVIKYIDKPNGGSIAYVRHDAMVKKLNNILNL